MRMFCMAMEKRNFSSYSCLQRAKQGPAIESSEADIASLWVNAFVEWSSLAWKVLPILALGIQSLGTL